MNFMAILLSAAITTSFSVNINQSDLKFCEFSDANPIILEKQITDFNNNRFKLYELDDGYAIYSLDCDNNENFVEGSYKVNSPFYDYFDYEIYYLGVGNYIYYDSGTFYDILTQSVISENLIGASYQLEYRDETSLSVHSAMNSLENTKIDSDDFTVIERDEYFRRLKSFPPNYQGVCGLTALSMLLGYLDTFYNDYFIPNDKEYDSIIYYSDGSIFRRVREELVVMGKAQYKNGTHYDYTQWSEMPGTSNAMQCYLFDKYMHTFLGIGSDSGYPMMDGELKETFNDYIDDNCSSLKNDYDILSGHLFNVNGNVQDAIDEGLPACLVLSSYTIENPPIEEDKDYKKAHVAIAYGYRDNRYLVHFGAGRGTTDYTEIVLADTTVYGYFAVRYKGIHTHSRNVEIESDDIVYGICGCGDVKSFDSSLIH